MPGYISRDAAIDTMRSLRSDFKAKNDWDSGYDTAIAEAFEHIKRVPVVDVQPVVRCKDCRYAHNLSDTVVYCKYFGCGAMSPNDFCSRGKAAMQDDK